MCDGLDLMVVRSTGFSFSLKLAGQESVTWHVPVPHEYAVACGVSVLTVNGERQTWSKSDSYVFLHPSKSMPDINQRIIRGSVAELLSSSILVLLRIWKVATCVT